MEVVDNAGHLVYSWIESVSTEKTCMPSGALRVGALRPLIWGWLKDVHTGVIDSDIPIDGDSAAIGMVAVQEERVVHADVLEGFYNTMPEPGHVFLEDSPAKDQDNHATIEHTAPFGSCQSCVR